MFFEFTAESDLNKYQGRSELYLFESGEMAFMQMKVLIMPFLISAILIFFLVALPNLWLWWKKCVKEREVENASKAHQQPSMMKNNISARKNDANKIWSPVHVTEKR